jgi:hypothetical protein
MKLQSVSKRRVRAALLIAGVAAATACMPRREPPPAPAAGDPARSGSTRPSAAASARRLARPALTPGGWTYRSEGQSSLASFGPAGAAASFTVRCDRASRQVRLTREGAANGNLMTVRTSSTARSLPVSVQAEPLPSASVGLAATDRLLDEIAFSRGRFTVELPGTPMLIIPAWPEPAPGRRGLPELISAPAR